MKHQTIKAGRPLRTLFVASAIVLLQSSMIRAQGCPGDFRSSTFYVENDASFAAWNSQADADFTSGERVLFSRTLPSRSLSDGPLGGFTRKVRNSLLFRLLDVDRRYTDTCYQETVGFGINLYTPTDLRAATRILNDRPYAGWAFAVYTLSAYSSDGAHDRTLDVYLGWIGPAVQGGWIQNRIHSTFGITYPDTGLPKIVNGWPNQLGNQPTLMFNYAERRRIVELHDRQGLGFDVNTTYGGTLGTPMTKAQAGATFRLGQNITDPAPPGITPLKVMVPSGLRQPFALDQGQAGEMLRRMQVYVFWEADADLIGRNSFLVGNLFSPIPNTIHERRFIDDHDYGFAVGYGAFRFAWRHVNRAHEFDPVLPPHGDRQVFGSMSISPEPITDLVWLGKETARFFTH